MCMHMHMYMYCKYEMLLPAWSTGLVEQDSCGHGSRSSVWCVLEAELVEMLPGAVLRVGALDPLAPRDAAGEGRVCLVPFDDHLPQIARPHEPHIHLSERAEEEVQPPVCDAGQERRTQVSGSAEVWGGVVPARLEWRCSHS